MAPAYRPPHWPAGVDYIVEPRYHSSVDADVLSHTKGTTKSTSQPTLCPVVLSLGLIRRITDPSHPACGQHGLFAAKKILPRTRIVYYLGEVHCDDRPESDYDLSLARLPGGISVGVDATRVGNEARFVNDFRGIRSKPNAAFEEDRSAAGELRMSVWSSNEVIKKGEEIVVSYGKSWWRERLSDYKSDLSPT